MESNRAKIESGTAVNAAETRAGNRTDALTAAAVHSALSGLVDPDFAKIQQSFFKTAPGEYGAGDQFIGVRVPAIRRVAREFRDLPLEQVDTLVASPIHELRYCALVILLNQFERAGASSVASAANTQRRDQLFDRYLGYYDRGFVNNWDLVDISAPRFGVHLLGRPDAMKLLTTLSEHENLWHQRVAMIFTFAFLRNGEFEPTLELARRYLTHEHDLIHKASGWLLREVGKRDQEVLRAFLAQHSQAMPRTALRYAIERLPEAERKSWLAAR
jgi:3-methyladenine DNA glycosylase AlkD